MIFPHWQRVWLEGQRRRRLLRARRSSPRPRGYVLEFESLEDRIVFSAGLGVLATAFNRIGIYTDGSTFNVAAGLDGKGFALSASQLGSSATGDNNTFPLGAPNANDVVSSAGQVIELSGSAAALVFLADAVNGSQTDQNFTVTYTDGTTQTFAQSFSDWFTPQNYTDESIAVPMGHRDVFNGGVDARTFYVYSYQVALDPNRIVQSVTLPNNANVEILAMDLMATISVSDGGTYNGTPFVATATVNGGSTLEGAGLTVSYFAGTMTTGTSLSGAPTQAGTYTVLASFPGTTNYAATSSAVTFTINRATPAVTVTDGGGTYTGSGFPASDTVAGLNGIPGSGLEGVSPTLTYYPGTYTLLTLPSGGTSTAPTAAGNYTVLANFAGSANYTRAVALSTFTIGRATPTVMVSDSGGTYNGTSTFPANANVAGVSGIAGTALEGVSPTFTYYPGTYTLLTLPSGGNSTAPSAAGNYTVLANFAGSADYTGAVALSTFSIGRATPMVRVSDAGGTYTGSGFPASANVAGVSGLAGSALEGVSPTLTYFPGTYTLLTLPSSGNSTAPSTAGNYTVLANFAGSADYTGAMALTTFAIGRATPTVMVSDAGGTYTGSGFPASANVTGVSGTPGSALEGISPTFTYYPGTYTLLTLPSSGNSTAPSAAGNYTVLANFAGSTDYTGAMALTTFAIGRATPTVMVSDAGGTYTGSGFPASANVTGVSGTPGSALEGISPTFTYYPGTYTLLTLPSSGNSTAPNAAGNYTVLANFAGSADYTGAMALTTFAIGRATPTVMVSDAGGTYTGSGFPASANVTGVSGIPGSVLEGISPTLTYYPGTYTLLTLPSGGNSTAPSAAGNYTVLANFAGSADYTGAMALTTFAIGRATPVVMVNDAGGTYTGNPFPASDTVAGVSGIAGSALEAISPTLTYYPGTYTLLTLPSSGNSTAPNAAGNYTVLANFAGSADYTGAMALTTFSIGRATPAVMVSDAGGTYSGSGFPASANVAGVSGLAGSALEGISPTLTYYPGTYTLLTLPSSGNSTAPNAAGNYTVLANFAGSADYTGAMALTTFSIGPATPTVMVSDAGGTYTGSGFPASDTVAGVNGIPGSTLEGISPTLTYYPGSYTLLTLPSSGNSTAPNAAGNYTVLANFAGSADYTGAMALTTFSIGPATPTVMVSDAGGTYTGSGFPASDIVAGVDGIPGSTLEGISPTLTYYPGSYTLLTLPSSGNSTAPNAAGNYTVLANFAGSADYTGAMALTTFSIGPATPTVMVSDAGGTYTGSGFPASDTVAGVNGIPGSTLEGISPTLTYYPGSYTLLTLPSSGNSTAPNAAGNYTVLANFASSADYTGAVALSTFTIGRAAPTVMVSDAGGTYTGSGFPATANVAGVSGITGSALEGISPTFTYYPGAYTLLTLPSSGGNSTAPSAAGNYTVLANFAGSADYTGAVALSTFTIGQATPAVMVTDAGGTYTGNAFPASDTVAGVNGIPGSALEGISPTLTYYPGTYTLLTLPSSGASTAPSAAGNYTVLANFAGSANYTGAVALSTFTIGQATPAVTVTDAGGTYTGNAFPASANVAGVNGVAGSALEGVSPTLTYYPGTYTLLTLPSSGGNSTAPSAAGNYTALANFAGSANYTGAVALNTFTIGQATPAVTVTDAGGTYTGNAFPASANVAGVNGVAGSALEGVSPTLTYYPGTYTLLTLPSSGNSTAPSAAGNYTVLANFSGSANYTGAVVLSTFTIGRATPTVMVSDAGGTYTGSGFPASANVMGVSGPAGSALEGISPTFTYYPGTYTLLTLPSSGSSTPPSVAGNYTVLANFAGSANYTGAVALSTFTIERATPAVTVTDAGGTYKTSAFAANATVAGVNGVVPDNVLEGIPLTLTYYPGTYKLATLPTSGGTSTAPSAAGNYTVVAKFAGSADYTSAAALTTFTIRQATATITLKDAGGTYDGTPFPATATVTLESGSTLKDVEPTLTYHDTTTGTLVDGVPSAAGTYTVLATLAETPNYSSATANFTFTIGRAKPTIALSDPSGSFTGNPFAATGTINGTEQLQGVGLTLRYYAGSTATGTGSHVAPSAPGTYTVAADFAGTADYLSASASRTFTIENDILLGTLANGQNSSTAKSDSSQDDILAGLATALARLSASKTADLIFAEIESQPLAVGQEVSQQYSNVKAGPELFVLIEDDDKAVRNFDSSFAHTGQGQGGGMDGVEAQTTLTPTGIPVRVPRSEIVLRHSPASGVRHGQIAALLALQEKSWAVVPTLLPSTAGTATKGPSASFQKALDDGFLDGPPTSRAPTDPASGDTAEEATPGPQGRLPAGVDGSGASTEEYLAALAAVFTDANDGSWALAAGALGALLSGLPDGLAGRGPNLADSPDDELPRAPRRANYPGEPAS